MNQHLRKTLLKKRFLNKNFQLNKLPKFTTKELCDFLKLKNLKEEARVFKREMIDGIGFIFIFTEEEGMDILRMHLGLSDQQIEKLAKLYQFIYHFRCLACFSFLEDEIMAPCFSKLF